MTAGAQSPDVPTITVNDEYDSCWYLAHSAEERLQAGEPRGETDPARGARRLATWLKEPVYANEPERWTESLSRMGIDESTVVDLLGEPAETVRSRFAEPAGYAVTLARAWREHGTTSDGDHALRGDGEPPADHAACSDPGHEHDRAGTTTVPAQSPAGGQYGFAMLARPLLRDAVERIRNGVTDLVAARPSPHIDPAVLIDQLTRIPMAALVQLVARTVVLELNVLRIQGELPGDTPEERFAAFVRWLGEPEHALNLLREYPVLARDLVRLLDNWATTQLEFAGRLVADVDELARRFPAPAELGTVTEVSFGAGDSHRGGRSVGIVTFTGGEKVVYKPRRLGVDLHFHDLIDWVNARGQNPPLRSFWIVDRSEYGWTEFVAAQPCADRAGLARFYRRQGAFLALLHSLAATDFHLENLIASGEHPVLVDLEALFHPWQPPLPSIPGLPADAFTLMRSSVLSVGLLPNPITWHDDDGMGHADLSGLAGAGGQLSPTAVPTWEDGGTDLMRLVRRRIEMPGANNLPALAGEDITPLQFRADLLAGYQEMYRLLLGNREEMLAPDGPMAAFANDEIRVIVRPTRTYALLMLESHHPDLLRDGLDRDRFFDNLWSSHDGVPERERIIAAELAQLRRGDVPIFWTTPSSIDLHAGDGSAAIPATLPRSGLDRAVERLQALSETDLKRQTWFIDASLAAVAIGALDIGWQTAPPRPAQAGEPAVQLPATAPDPAECLAVARRVGDRLVTIALGEDTISWLGLNLVGERLWQLNPAGIDMFNGLSGIGLFLGYLGDAAGEERYRAAAERTAKVLVEQAEQLPSISRESFVHGSNLGVFTGLGAIVHSLSHLSVLWQRPDLADAAAGLIPLIDSLVDDDRTLDIIGGSAGGLLASLALHTARPGDGRALALARRMGAHLAATARDAEGGRAWHTETSPELPLAGFSHGAAGIAFALSRLDGATGERRYAALVRDAVRYERSVYDPAITNWRDLRSITPDDMNMVAWCHGAAGVGMARAELLTYLGDEPMVAEDLTRAIAAVRHLGLGIGNHSICHGELGNVEALLLMGERADDRAAVAHAQSAASAALRQINETGWMTGVPLGVETPGLMPGLAGIGYNLLRLWRPDRVPSILLLDPPSGELR